MTYTVLNNAFQNFKKAMNNKQYVSCFEVPFMTAALLQASCQLSLRSITGHSHITVSLQGMVRATQSVKTVALSSLRK